MGGKPHAWQAHAVGRRVEEVGWGGTYSVGVAKAASAEYSSAACSSLVGARRLISKHTRSAFCDNVSFAWNISFP